MNTVILTLLSLSLSGSVMALILLLLRPVLKKKLDEILPILYLADRTYPSGRSLLF